MKMKMRYLTQQNLQIYLEASAIYFNTEDFNWSAYKYTLITSCVGYNSPHKVATLLGDTGINWNYT